MENDVLDRAFMGYDQKIFPLQISAFYQTLHITVIKFLPRFAARIIFGVAAATLINPSFILYTSIKYMQGPGLIT